jgi:hypothetical protein
MKYMREKLAMSEILWRRGDKKRLGDKEEREPPGRLLAFLFSQ